MKTELNRILLPLGIGLVAGAAIAAVVVRREPNVPAPQTVAPPAPLGRDDVALLKSLLAERDSANQQLRAEIAALKTKPAPTKPAAVASPVVAATSTNSWLERLRQEDPERFKQIQEAREQRRKAVEDWFNNTYSRLDDRLQKAQTKEEVDLVEQIADATAKLQELGQRWQQVRELPDDQRREAAATLGAETREAFQTLSELRQQDRQFQLQQLATQIGYKDSNSAGQFVESVNTIIKDTEINPMRGMGWGGGRGPGGGNPAR